MSKLQKKIMSKLQKKNMSKLQKNISIIFFLFFIYYLISKNFSLKFREGASGKKKKKKKGGAAVEETKKPAEDSNKKSNKDADKKTTESPTPKPQKKKHDPAVWEKAQCKDTIRGKYKRYQMSGDKCSSCVNKKWCNKPDFSSWKEESCKMSGCKRAWLDQIWNIPEDYMWEENKNPCMTKPFCKNCKTCKDEGKLGQVDGEKTISLKDGTDFDCKKCEPEKVEATGDDDSKKCEGTQILFFCV